MPPHPILLASALLAALLLLLSLLLLAIAAYHRRSRASAAAAGAAAQHGDAEEGFMASSPDDDDDDDDAALLLTSLHPFSPPISIRDVLASVAQPLPCPPGSRVGAAYKIHLRVGACHKALVVKHLGGARLGRRQFQLKVHQLWQFRHSSLLPIKAYYYSRAHKFLLYDYLASGSLLQALHGADEASPYVLLDWPSRARMAQQLAAGIACIHSGQDRLFHGNIKSSNVLLITDMGACLTEYGLAGFYDSRSFRASRTGYTAPELYKRGARFTQQADVYSYGVLLLELLTGKYPTPPSTVAGKLVLDLPGWVLTSIHEEWTEEVFDPNIEEVRRHEEGMVAMLKIALACVALSAQERPPIAAVLEMVEAVIKGAGLECGGGGGEPRPECGVELVSSSGTPAPNRDVELVCLAS